MALNDNYQQAKIVGLLKRCWVSIIHHSDALKGVIQLNPSHPLYQEPVLSYDAIFSNLKPLVTTYPY